MSARSVRLSRSLTLQLALAAAVFLIFWMLASTAAQNLRALGIASGFGFLQGESGFVIGETTILSHDPADTYARALLVGAVNTVRVALLAILFSTVIGALLSLARLSPNRLLAGLAAGYVEIFRNTPLIVQLFFWYAMLTEHLPPAAEAWSPVPGVFVSNRGIIFPSAHLAGSASWVLMATFLSGSVAFIAARVKRHRPAGMLTAVLVLLVPAAVFLFVAQWERPQLSGFGFIGGAALSPEFAALLLGLSLYTAAFIGEILRAGFLAVEQGQIESGHALGLSRRQVMRFIVVPQALRLAVPPVTSQYLNCVKNSSLAVAIGYPDLVSIANTTINQTGQAIEGFAIIILAYLTVSVAIAAAMNAYNRRVALRGIG